MQRRLTLLVDGSGVGAVLQEQPGHIDLALPGRPMQSRAAGFVTHVDLPGRNVCVRPFRYRMVGPAVVPNSSFHRHNYPKTLSYMTESVLPAELNEEGGQAAAIDEVTLDSAAEFIEYLRPNVPV